MKYDVTVQASEYHEKVYTIEADNPKDAEIEAIKAAEIEINDDNDPRKWKDLGTDFEVFAPITLEE